MLHTERHKYLILLTGENPTNIENLCHETIVQILFSIASELSLGAGKICKYTVIFYFRL